MKKLEKKIDIPIEERIKTQEKYQEFLEQQISQIEQENNMRKFQKELIGAFKTTLSTVQWRVGDMTFTITGNYDEVTNKIDEQIEFLMKKMQPLKVKCKRLSKEHLARMEREKDANNS